MIRPDSAEKCIVENLETGELIDPISDVDSYGLGGLTS
jgi:hypothetical protein